MSRSGDADRILRAIDAARDEMVSFAQDLIRIPSVNPPGQLYRECAELIGRQLERCGFDVEYVDAAGRPEHTDAHPRCNVIGTRTANGSGPAVHLNGHFDVVPEGGDWTVDSFGGTVLDGRLYGRGSADMKAGLACRALCR